jgi:adenosylhomocysteinase
MDNESVAMGVDKYDWTRAKMPLVYKVANAILDKTDKKVAVGLPLTWETLCLVDALHTKVPNLIVIPRTSGKNSSLQPGVFPYLDRWQVAYYKTASERTRSAVLKQIPDVIIDCGFGIGEVAIENDLLDRHTIILEDTKTGENLIEAAGLTNPYVILDNSPLKRRYENQEGIGYSVIAALAGMGIYLPNYTVGIIGYGYVGKGLAKYARALGAKVIIYDCDEGAQTLASKDYETCSKEQLLHAADIVITATGTKDVITRQGISDLDRRIMLVNAGGDEEWDRQRLFGDVAINHIHENITQSKVGSCTVWEVCGGNSVNLVIGVSVSEFLDVTFAHLVAIVAQLDRVKLKDGKNDIASFDNNFLENELLLRSFGN